MPTHALPNKYYIDSGDVGLKEHMVQVHMVLAPLLGIETNVNKLNAQPSDTFNC